MGAFLMSLFQINVVISLEPQLQKLLRDFVDLAGDRLAAAALTADVKARTDALGKAVSDNQP